MKTAGRRALTDVIGAIPYRMAFAGGWIDQPFVSRLNPSPSGSMVVVSLEPTCRFMERAGMATGTRQVALGLWSGRLPDRAAAELVRELYAEENRGKSEPSGSQDMIGLVYPGVCRLEYDFSHEGGVFPRHIEYRVLPASQMRGFPEPPPTPSPPGRKKVVATGCYDWFHTGHVRFTEEVSALGDLYVVLGHDANIRLLKGDGHPLFPQAERRYVVGSIKYVKQALISSGEGWLDADPEIRCLKPDIYVVNEDGDRGGKREYCEKLGIEYLVLKRTPAPGLPPRSSTVLRGF